jgi:glycosyltransferase involved in cell wall biosynthesis
MKENNIMLSVHMITYNHEKYIANAIESVVNQKTKYKYEIIIGEDCSTDNTLAIIKEYKERYPDVIRIISSETNVGMFANVERVTAACNGKYVAFLEGDDYWHNLNKIEVQLDFMEKNPDYGFISSDIDYYHDRTGKLDVRHNHRKRRRKRHGLIFEELLRSNFIKTPTICINRELFLKCNVSNLGKEKGWKMGDYPQWLELSKNTKYYYEDQSLATYRICEHSASHIQDHEKELEFDKSTLEIRLYYIEKYSNNKEKHIQDAVRVYIRDLYKILKKYKEEKYKIVIKDIISTYNYKLTFFDRIKFYKIFM